MTRNHSEVYIAQVRAMLESGDRSENQILRITGMSGNMWKKTVRPFLLSREMGTVGRGAGKMYTLLYPEEHRAGA